MNAVNTSDIVSRCLLHHSGERTVIIEVQSKDRIVANRFAREIAARIAARNHSFIHDIGPAMTTVGIHYDPHRVDVGAGDKPPNEVVEASLKQYSMTVV